MEFNKILIEKLSKLMRGKVNLKNLIKLVQIPQSFTSTSFIPASYQLVQIEPFGTRSQLNQDPSTKVLQRVRATSLLRPPHEPQKHNKKLSPSLPPQSQKPIRNQ